MRNFKRQRRKTGRCFTTVTLLGWSSSEHTNRWESFIHRFLNKILEIQKNDRRAAALHHENTPTSNCPLKHVDFSLRSILALYLRKLVCVLMKRPNLKLKNRAYGTERVGLKPGKTFERTDR